MSFKNTKTFEDRLFESKRINEKYPDRIPIICEQGKKCTLPIIDKYKFLVPNNLTVSQFSYVIRKRICIKPETAIFITCDSRMLNYQDLIKDVYIKNKDTDGFLYLQYSGENVFG